MNVLIVGGAGYVGSVLVRELLGRRHKVKVLDRLYFGDVGLRGIPDLELVIGDMRSLPDGLLDGIDAIVNVGGLSNDPTAEYAPEANWQMNTFASIDLAKAGLRHGITRYVFASSASTYDTGVIDSEADDIIQDEDTPVNPTRPYSASKYAAERALLELKETDGLCPVILRKGTIFGFSPRMRYDLVVNTMVKDALSKGVITIHAGGEMWRPLVDVRDAARAYATVLEAPEEKVVGQIFNVSRKNYRISELALWLKTVLGGMDIPVRVQTTYTQTGVRSYRISNRKLKETLGFEYKHDIEHSVREMVRHILEGGYDDFESPLYYNISWMKTLEQAEKVISVTGSVFGG